jgi:cation transport regulator
MPYPKLADLPESVKHVLPKHAQEIYRAAFNNAWDEYARPSDRHDDSSREETAHAVAWAAVKKKYEKNDATGQWERVKLSVEE